MAGLLALLCAAASSIAILAPNSTLAAGLAGNADPAAPSAQPEPVARVEARSADLLAVGTVRGERMTIHLSRIADNAPVRDAAVTVLLRGTAHAAVAEADGSYSLETPDLALPGAAAVQFQVTEGAVRQDLQGALQVAGGSPEPQAQGTSRQIGWWVLNFAVCIGFLLLWSRRKSAGS